MNATTESLSPGAIPWYRQNWFGIVCVLLFPPALLFPLLTGDIYYFKDQQMKPYSKGVKAFLLIWAGLGAVYFVSNFTTGFIKGYRAATSRQETAPAAAATATTSPPEAAGPSDEDLLEQIWAAYRNLPGNRGSDMKDVNVHGDLVKRGTVLPRAMNSSVTERLPAYLACYDFIMVFTGNMGGGDLKSNMCLYYIQNPTVGTEAVMWRGKDNAYELDSQMAKDGFVATGGSEDRGDQKPTPAAAVPSAQVPPVAASSAPSAAPPAPTESVQPSSIVERPTAQAGAEAMDGASTVRAFYSALGRGDGDHANALMVLEKRAAPAFQPDAIEAFYGHMAEPLTLESVTAAGPAQYEVRYRYRKQTAVCQGRAIVTTQEAEGRNLIARIRPIGNC